MNKWTESQRVILVAALLSMTPLSADCKTPHKKILNAGQIQAKKLQHAVDEIYIAPSKALGELRGLPGATAKAYVAFLYKSRKVPVPNADKQADLMMRKAVNLLPTDQNYGDLDREQIHYKTMTELLRTLRFIEESGDGVTPPIGIFKQYPEETLEAFAAYYYSSMERYDGFEISKRDDVFEIPQMNAVGATLTDMYGEAQNPGTIVQGYYRKRHLAAIEASIAPQVYAKEFSSSTAKTQLKEVDAFLKLWSTNELWNQQMYLKMQRQMKAAEKPLAEHYKQRLSANDLVAHKYAKAVLNGYMCLWLDNFSHSFAEQQERDPVYTAFSTPGLTVDGIKAKIGAREMTGDELKQALRLAILCGGTVDAVEWVVKHGASLDGDSETALFSAAKRPDVVALLLQAGAKVNAENPLGKTALIQAAQYDSLETVKLLVEAGADVNHAMCKSGEEMPEKLKYEALYNYKTGARTALMYASAFSGKATIDYLLSKGADRKLKDSDGWTAVKFLQWNKIISKAERAALVQALK